MENAEIFVVGAMILAFGTAVRADENAHHEMRPVDEHPMPSESRA